MKRLAVLISFSGDGGVERMVTNLCAEFAQHVRVDLLALKFGGGHASRISSAVNVMPLNAQHAWSSVPEIAAYLCENRPDAMLVAKDRAGRAALKANVRAATNTPIFIRLGTNLSAALARKDKVSRWMRVTPMRRLYPLATGVIAVSEGVREDIIAITELPPERVHVIRNPVITSHLAELSRDAAPHPWLAQKTLPVVMGMGRLTAQKDFPTLLRAFASMQAEIPSRLILLGEGPQPGDRERLEALARELGVAERVLFPGFQKNPYAWLSRADLFVLASAWEGSPNALTEALALGVPSVSTDCPSGPGEILARGEFGPLVAVGDSAAMARAMIQVLRAPLPAHRLRAAVVEYRADLSAQRYLRLMKLIPEPG